jgi:aspartate 1-decarboxylase
MLIRILKSKLHRAVVTCADLNYEGSISIDSELMKLAGIVPNEVVSIWNINNGERFETYAIPAAPNSGEIGLNGAAARLVQVGDLLVIAAFCFVELAGAAKIAPAVVILNGKDNRLADVRK